MAKVIYVRRARKAHPGGIRRGESYFHWKPYRQARRTSKARPKPSQLARSPFLAALLRIQEGLPTAGDPQDVAGAFDDAANDLEALAQDQEDSLANMPESLQQGDVGQLLERRSDVCRCLAEDLERAADEISSAEDDGLDVQQIIDDALGALDWSVE